MPKYIHPTPVTAISDSFADHLVPSPDRGGKPSVNPGVDYKAKVGDPLWAVADGTIQVCSSGIAGSGGRYVQYVDIYGNVFQDLHLRNILVTPGQTVKQGQQIANTGASANGSEYGVGQHVHHTMKLGGTRNVDFELYVGSDSAGGNYTPIANGDDDEMLTPEAQTWITATVRDQVNALLRDTYVPAIKEAIKAGNDAEHQELAGRIDKVLAPKVREIIANQDEEHQEIAGRIDQVLAPALVRIEAAVTPDDTGDHAA